MINPFQWKNGKAMTPEEVDRARALADAALGRAGDTSPVGHWTQGAARVIDTLGGVLKDKRASKAEKAGLAGADAYIQGNPVLAALLGGGGNYAAGGGSYSGGGGSSFVARPAPAKDGFSQGANVSPEEMASIDERAVGDWNGGPIDAMKPEAFSTFGVGQGPDTQYNMGEAQNPLAAGIVETANAIGMAPEDLATIISYETAGTFDPTKAGPTTQWGQHRGLIQFGEPQASEYGVDWNDPIGSQLGADGAVARYFTKNGWQPGMGLLDAYSIVNAGGPGRYNASDANNGGAPGTVADKVNNQMGGHREKALALLGGEYTPAEGGSYTGGGMSSGGSPIPMSGGGANVTSALMAAMSDPWVAKKYGPVLNALMGQEMKRGDMQYEAQLRQSDPMYQAQLKAAEAALQPAPMKPIEVGGVLLDPVTYQPIYDSRTPAGGDGFTLGEGQVRFDANGQMIAQGPQAPPPDPTVPTTKNVTLDDGSEVMVQWNPQTQVWDAAPIPQGGTTGTGQGAAKLTESQAKTTLFQTLQAETAPVLEQIESVWDPANLSDAAARSTPIAGNFFKSEEGQMYASASSAWAEGALRISTGAAATEPEIQRIQATYFAQPGDTPAVIEFKKGMREMYSRAIKSSLGKDTSQDGSLMLPDEFAKKYAAQFPPPMTAPVQPQAGQPVTTSDGYTIEAID